MELGFIAGFAAGFTVLGVAILIGWYFIKRRRAQMKAKLTSSAHVKSRFLGLQPSLDPEKVPMYLEIPHETALNASYFNTKSLSDLQRVQNIEFILPVTPPSTKGDPYPIRRGISLRRSNSCDSASIYSTNSASPSYHDHAFRPSSPDSDSSFDTYQAASDIDGYYPLSRYIFPTRPLLQFREELAPETYAKGQRRAVPVTEVPLPYPRRTTSEMLSTPPVPPLSEYRSSLNVSQAVALHDEYSVSPSPTDNRLSRKLAVRKLDTFQPPAISPSTINAPVPLKFKQELSGGLPAIRPLDTSPLRPPIRPPEVPPRSPLRESSRDRRAISE